MLFLVLWRRVEPPKAAKMLSNLNTRQGTIGRESVPNELPATWAKNRLSKPNGVRMTVLVAPDVTKFLRSVEVRFAQARRLKIERGIKQEYWKQGAQHVKSLTPNQRLW